MIDGFGECFRRDPRIDPQTGRSLKKYSPIYESYIQRYGLPYKIYGSDKDILPSNWPSLYILTGIEDINIDIIFLLDIDSIANLIMINKYLYGLNSNIHIIDKLAKLHSITISLTFLGLYNKIILLRELEKTIFFHSDYLNELCYPSALITTHGPFPHSTYCCKFIIGNRITCNGNNYRIIRLDPPSIIEVDFYGNRIGKEIIYPQIHQTIYHHQFWIVLDKGVHSMVYPGITNVPPELLPMFNHPGCNIGWY